MSVGSRMVVGELGSRERFGLSLLCAEKELEIEIAVKRILLGRCPHIAMSGTLHRHNKYCQPQEISSCLHASGKDILI